jgi:hypothetical protein
MGVPAAGGGATDPQRAHPLRDFGNFGWRPLQNEATLTRLSRLLRLWRQSLEAFPLAPAPARAGGLRI